MNEGLLILGVIFAFILVGILGNIGRLVTWLGLIFFEGFAWFVAFLCKGVLFLVLLFGFLFILAMAASKL
jgi:hypothetical protein